MSYTVRLTDTAKQDLREIAFWIADQSKDPEIAKRFVEELRYFSLCGRFPERQNFKKCWLSFYGS